MSTRIKMYMIFGLSFLLVGCGSTMYFYETEKISLTVEARPDSSQPVQGSLGIKQRVVLVAPKKENGEAVSALSSFNFKIIPRSWTPFNAVLVQTAFVTGEAAKLSPPLAAQVARAITLDGVEIKGIGEHADCIIKNNAEQGTLSVLKGIVDHDFDRLSDEDWGNLRATAQPCGVLDRQNYTLSLHKALQKKFN